MATSTTDPLVSPSGSPFTPREAYLALHNPAHDRLSIPFPLRLPLALILAAVSGSVLGLSQGGLVAGLRFRAENAHRQPNTQTGWYLYHKSKNYHVALGGVLEAFKMAGKLGLWVGVFVTMEEGLDRGRAGLVRVWRGVRGGKEEDVLVESSRDFVSTTLAGLGTAGAFSTWNRFPVATAVRTARMGAKVGFGFGIAEDVAEASRSWWLARARQGGITGLWMQNITNCFRNRLNCGIPRLAGRAACTGINTVAASTSGVPNGTWRRHGARENANHCLAYEILDVVKLLHPVCPDEEGRCETA
ncbi:hypothetical protein LTR12_009651 [Friedmanniomyces endolithicus]|nr:hypothetical protein LTR12_009651 [Friedmanniomyces endolithicus]